MNKYQKTSFVLITLLAAAINAFSVKIFLTPMHIVPLGVPGLSYLLQTLIKLFTKFYLPYYIIFFTITILISIWAYNYLDKKMTLKTLLYMVFFTIISKYIPNIHLTNDKILLTVFAAFFNAFASGLLLYVGSTIGGYTLIGLFLSKKYKKSLVGTTNRSITFVVIFIFCLMTKVENGMYSLLLTFVSSKIVDKLNLQTSYVTLIIVTKHSNEINEYINSIIKRTSTIIDSVGSYSRNNSKTILLTLSKVKINDHINNFKKIDKDIHISMLQNEKVIGNMKSDVGKQSI